MKHIPKILTSALLSAFLALGAAAMGSAGRVRVSGRLNVRAAASTSSAVRTTLTNGTYVTLLCDHGDWWFVEYADGRYGYVHGDYIEKLPAAEASVHTRGGNLNVRSGAGLGFDVTDSLQNGENVLILDTKGDFAQVLYDGNEVGYASTAYLNVHSAVFAPITLQVPSYKQYAAEYASLHLPGSGESVRTHGCAVTSLAMVESYRKGYAVTPKDVLETENFTDSGAIWWPAGYTRGEVSAAYLIRQLAAGKPVIVHGQKADGTSHFAVVYGYTGGTLAAERFLLQDPGSSVRKTLADFLAVYPTLVKTVSY